MAALPDRSTIDCFLLDIEGTTTPVDFVYKTLFPFAAERVEGYLRAHWSEPKIAALAEELRRLQDEDARQSSRVASLGSASREVTAASVAAYVRQLIAADRKVTPLKSLQGMIWEEGFLSGTLKGEVYDDVPRAFQRWANAGKRIAIFSSGSVLAQKLLFGYSTAGDLTPYVCAYFDTTTGPKRESSSYKTIANSLQMAADRICFASDVDAELDAAVGCGMQTILIVRQGVKPVVESHLHLPDFEALR